MKKDLRKRILKEASRIVESHKTLRELAGEFGISKSTLHKDMQQKLPLIDRKLYREVQQVFNEHLESRYNFLKKV